MEVSGQLHASGTHWTGGWVGLRAGLDKFLIQPKSELRLWFHDFDLFQVKVQLIFKFEVDYIVFLILDDLLLF
jgi:hypothetical protein